MRPVMYAFIFAIVLLIFKAFVLDDYIAKNYGDTNATEESNLSTEVNSASTTPVQPEPEVKPQPVIPPETKPIPKENTLSGMAPEKQEKKEEPEDKKMPLDKLGDSLSKHIKL